MSGQRYSDHRGGSPYRSGHGRRFSPSTGARPSSRRSSSPSVTVESAPNYAHSSSSTSYASYAREYAQGRTRFSFRQWWFDKVGRSGRSHNRRRYASRPPPMPPVRQHRGPRTSAVISNSTRSSSRAPLGSDLIISTDSGIMSRSSVSSAAVPVGYKRHWPGYIFRRIVARVPFGTGGFSAFRRPASPTYYRRKDIIDITRPSSSATSSSSSHGEAGPARSAPHAKRSSGAPRRRGMVDFSLSQWLGLKPLPKVRYPAPTGGRRSVQQYSGTPSGAQQFQHQRAYPAPTFQEPYTGPVGPAEYQPFDDLDVDALSPAKADKKPKKDKQPKLDQNIPRELSPPPGRPDLLPVRIFRPQPHRYGGKSWDFERCIFKGGAYVTRTGNLDMYHSASGRTAEPLQNSRNNPYDPIQIRNWLYYPEGYVRPAGDLCCWWFIWTHISRHGTLSDWRLVQNLAEPPARATTPHVLSGPHTAPANATQPAKPDYLPTGPFLPAVVAGLWQSQVCYLINVRNHLVSIDHNGIVKTGHGRSVAHPARATAESPVTYQGYEYFPDGFVRNLQNRAWLLVPPAQGYGGQRAQAYRFTSDASGWEWIWCPENGKSAQKKGKKNNGAEYAGSGDDFAAGPFPGVEIEDPVQS